MDAAKPVVALVGALGSTQADGTNTDFEDHNRAEDALRASENRFRLIVDNMPSMMCTLTAEGEVEFVNQQILNYFGKTLEELKHWASSDAVHPDDLPRVIDAWRRSLSAHQHRARIFH